MAKIVLDTSDWTRFGLNRLQAYLATEWLRRGGDSVRLVVSKRRHAGDRLAWALTCQLVIRYRWQRRFYPQQAIGGLDESS